MVGAFGEVQVMDWGLAKVLGEGSPGTADALSAEETRAWTQVSPAPASGSHTQAGSLVGTPAFIPPEQALGEIEKVDERSDVFGLGAILAVILTGKPPYVGESFESVRVQAVRGKLDDCFARLDACGAEPELVALCKKCLAFEPADRPPDAVAAAVAGLRAAADERARQAELERVEAEGKTREALARAAEQRRRRRIVVTASEIIALVFLVGFAGVLWQWRVAETARDWAETEATRASQQKRLAEDNLTKAEKAEKVATEQRNRADDAAERTRQNLYYAQMHLAQQAWRDHRGLPHMRELLANWLPKGESHDRRGWEWFYLNSLPYQNLRTLTESESSQFMELASRARPCTVAWHIASDRLAEGTVDGWIRIWDVDREQTIMSVKGPAPVD
jgi:Protein kinase domain